MSMSEVTRRGVRVPSDRVREVLAAAEVEGRLVRIRERLDRREYVAVDKALRALGGRWSRRLQAHEFDRDAAPLLEATVAGAGAATPERTRDGFVATPPELARRIVRDDTEIGDADVPLRVLEPSAGTGALVHAILDSSSLVTVMAVEPDKTRARQLPAGPRLTVRPETFEHFATTAPAPFDAIVMNPPFATTASPTLWIDHLQLAWDLLAPAGRITAILPAALAFRQDHRHRGARELVATFGGYRELPEDAFSSAGTQVRAVVAWLIKPGSRRSVR